MDNYEPISPGKLRKKNLLKRGGKKGSHSSSSSNIRRSSMPSINLTSTSQSYSPPTQSILKKGSSYYSSSSSSSSSESLTKTPKSQRSGSSLSFSPQPNAVFLVPKLPTEVLDDCFYDDDQIAKFRYDAFLEDCGLDPTEYE